MNNKIDRYLAEEVFENYDFGDGVTVEAVSGWEYNSKDPEMTCSVFLRFDTDEQDQDTHLGRFNVVFSNGVVVDASCYCEGMHLGVAQLQTV